MLLKVSLTLLIFIAISLMLHIDNPKPEVKEINDAVGAVFIMSLSGLIICLIVAIWTTL